MANLGSIGITRHIDDPEVSEVNATPGASVTWGISSDTSDTAFAKAVAVGKGLHYAGATTTTDNNMIEFCSNDLIFSGQEGHSEVEILLQLDVITNISFAFGFNDDVLDDSNSIPVSLSTTTFTINATDAFCGFVYDTNATYDELHCVWVDGGTAVSTDSTSSSGGSTLRMKGMGLTAAKWLYMKVELDDLGSGNHTKATFLAVDHNGKSMEKTFTTTVDRNIGLCYYLGVQNCSATAHNCYIKHCNWAQSIADM